MKLAVLNFQSAKRVPKPVLFFGLFLLLCILGCGFFPLPDSVNGIATDDTVRFDPTLIGTWELEQQEQASDTTVAPATKIESQLTIESQDKRLYQISFTTTTKDGDKKEVYDGATKAKLVKLGEFFFLDCFDTTIKMRKDGRDFLNAAGFADVKASNGTAAHSFYVLAFKDDKLCLTPIRPALHANAKSELCKTEVTEIQHGKEVRRQKDRRICTAETPDLQAVMKKFVTSGNHILNRNGGEWDTHGKEMVYTPSVQAKAKVVAGDSVASASQRTLTAWMELRHYVQGLAKAMITPSIPAPAPGVKRSPAEEQRLVSQVRRQALADFTKAIGNIPTIGVDASLTELVEQLSVFAKRLDGQLDEDALNAQGFSLLLRRAAGQDVAQEGQAMVREAKAARDEWSRLPDTLEAVRKRLSQKHEVNFPKVDWEVAKQ